MPAQLNYLFFSSLITPRLLVPLQYIVSLICNSLQPKEQDCSKEKRINKISLSSISPNVLMYQNFSI